MFGFFFLSLNFRHLSLITLKYHVCLAPSLTSHHSIFFTLFVSPIPVTRCSFFFFLFFFLFFFFSWVGCSGFFFFTGFSEFGYWKKKKKKLSWVIGMGPTNSVKNIEWWEVSDGAKQIWYFRVMSDGNWVTKKNKPNKALIALNL